jgi:hypothetical protein
MGIETHRRPEERESEVSHNVVDDEIVASNWRQLIRYRLSEQLRLSHEKMKNLSYNIQGRHSR